MGRPVGCHNAGCTCKSTVSADAHRVLALHRACQSCGVRKLGFACKSASSPPRARIYTPHTHRALNLAPPDPQQPTFRLAASRRPDHIERRDRLGADPGIQPCGVSTEFPHPTGVPKFGTPANRHVARDDTGFGPPHGLRSVLHTHDPSIQAGSSALLSTRANGDEPQPQRSAYPFL